MGETLKREFQPGQVITGGGQARPDIDVMAGPGEFVSTLPQPPTPLQTRPTFLSAYLRNLGPALAGGAGTGSFSEGLGGALRGIEEQKRYQAAESFKQQQESRLRETSEETLRVRESLGQLQAETSAGRLGLQKLGVDIAQQRADIYKDISDSQKAFTMARTADITTDNERADLQLAETKRRNDFYQTVAQKNLELREKGLGQYLPVENPMTKQLIGAWNAKTGDFQFAPNELTGATRTSYSPTITNAIKAANQLNEDISAINKMRERLGPKFADMVGFIQGNWAKIKSKTIGTNADTADLVTRLARMLDNQLRIASGAQIGEYEYPRLEAYIPTISTPDTNFFVKLRQLKEYNDLGLSQLTGKGGKIGLNATTPAGSQPTVRFTPRIQ